MKAHPRSRGENGSACSMISVKSGSSPLTRGKPARCWHGRVGDGLIPAHAGKTSRSRAGTPTPWAHPRSRGENVSSLTGRRRGRGSSPLTRGKHLAPPCLILRAGLIPAHAGKTLRALVKRAFMTAHPRSRGENDGHDVPWESDEGSSPLTRGKPLVRTKFEKHAGLIPAHAGKTAT